MIVRTDSVAFGAWPDSTGTSTALVVNPLSNWWSYALTLELASRLNTQGRRVHYLDLGPMMPNSLQANGKDTTSTWRFKHPYSRKDDFLTEQGIQVVQVAKSDMSTMEPVDFGTLSELRAWTYEGKRFGAVVAAAVSGTLMQRDFDIRTNAKLIQQHVSTSIQVSGIICSVLSELSPDLVGTTNDRILGAGISLLESRLRNVETLIAYWGSDSGRLVTYSKSLYSSEEWRAFIAKKWESEPPSDDKLIALNAEIDRVGRVGFPASQIFKPMLVSEHNVSLPSTLRSVVFFASTPWEYSGLTEYPEGYFADQVTAVRSLLTILDPDEWTVYVRHHPPRRGEKARAEVDSWESLRNFPNLVEIAPDAQVDSYKLMDESDINAVWVSTIGAESIAKRKRTLVMGRPYWLDPAWTCAAPTADALRQFFTELPAPIDPNWLRPYLYYIESNGVAFEFVHGVGPELLKVGGIRLYPRTALGVIVSFILRVVKAFKR